jgi:uncharacterized protein with HEPN domain
MPRYGFHWRHQEGGGNGSLVYKGLDLPKFLEDRKTEDAVVRNFEVMGDAERNISSAFKAKYPEVPWKTLAGLRDKLIHFNFGSDYEIVGSV